MSSSAPPTTSSGSGSKNNYKGKNNKRKGNNNDKKRWGNKKQFDREAGRTNYESKNQGYSQYGPAGQDQRRGTNEDDAPHPGSYAVELYNAKKADAEAKKPDGEDVEKPDEAATMASDALRKYPKRKLAFLLGFCGKNYGGMQMNPGVKTIQAEVEKALFSAEAIAPINYGFPKKYGWSNSARTDKGVHAAAQVCSARVAVPTGDDLDALRVMVNKNLPDDICILDIKKVTKSFNAKTSRDKVRYQYMLPTYVLQPKEDLKAAFDEVVPNKSSFVDLDDDCLEKLQARFVKYRSTPAILERLKATFETYEGTKKYHNFTNGKSYTDPSARRYMMRFKPVETGVVYGEDGMEWIAVAVTGQAFLLHQIRKMVSLGVDVVRGVASEEQMLQSFNDGAMKLSIAPSQGLFLDMSYFDLACGRENFAHDKLEWGENGTDATKRWSDFKREKIVNHILAEEANERNFLKYMYHQEFFFSSSSSYKFYDEQMNDGTDWEATTSAATTTTTTTTTTTNITTSSEAT
ncbi:hypothetical protein TrST_g4260 [Triparma strigata]|uniref:Pseudouridine synthase I TruA alpha/beta domain-containing protein n=1 Tax=Triparma strigata TaxID=1606541 RepID=A0A9W7BJ14_9STRA|nr:hypothetical protein TrST_g4260 [Triparma strigata]